LVVVAVGLHQRQVVPLYFQQLLLRVVEQVEQMAATV
jgi:hypothetical protein